MRHLCWAMLLALVVCAGCAKSPDPIIGTWVDAKYGETMLTFAADGTATYTIDWDLQLKHFVEKYARQPDRLARLKKLIAQQRAKPVPRFPWAHGKVCYEVTSTADDSKRTTTLYLQLDNGTLYFCDSNGVIARDYAFQRKESTSEK